MMGAQVLQLPHHRNFLSSVARNAVEITFTSGLNLGISELLRSFKHMFYLELGMTAILL